MALQAYIDDSQTDGGALVLAGFISEVEKWAAFSVEWKQHLDSAGMEEFKMAEFGHSAPEIVASFYRIAEKHAIGIIAGAVPIATLAKVAAEFSDRPIDRNPYLFAFKSIVNLCAQYQHNMGIDEPIDFLFDEKVGEQNIIHAGWKHYAESVPLDVKKNTGAMPIFRDSKFVMPIQAADLIAWWFRRMYLAKGRMSHWPFPWTEQRRLALMSFSFDEDDIRQIFWTPFGFAEFDSVFRSL